MVVKYLGDNEWYGLSTDSKPTNVADGAIFHEVDTQLDSIWSAATTSWLSMGGGSWNPTGGETFSNKTIPFTNNNIGLGMFRIVCSQSGPTFYARSWNGSLISQSTTPEAVLQSALAIGGGIKVMGGSQWDFSAGFTGLLMTKSNCVLYLDPDTLLRVPNGYTGSMFTFASDTDNVRKSGIVGGRLGEQGVGAEDRLWTAVSLETTDGSGVYFCFLKDVDIVTPGIGVKLKATHSLQGVNSNHFEDVTCTYPDIGFDFESNFPTSGISSNTFVNCNTQPFPPTYPQTYGFRNQGDAGNTFINCSVWDLDTPATQKSMTIKPTTARTRIFGGIIDRYGFYVDNSTANDTLIIGGYSNKLKLGNMSLIPSVGMLNGRRIGGYAVLGSVRGYGYLANDWTDYTGEASSTTFIVGADGTAYRRRTTGGTSGNGAGNKYTAGPGVSCRQWNPIFRFKFRLNQTGINQRIWQGIVGGTADRSGDDPLNVQYGILLCLRASDGIFQLAHNDAAGTTNFIPTGLTVDTAIHQFEIMADNGASLPWSWRLDAGTWTQVPTAVQIPSPTQPVHMFSQMQTVEAAPKSFDQFLVEVETS